MFASPRQGATGWAGLDSRDQARRLPHPRRTRCEGGTLHTRRGYDFADRFPLAAAAIAKLSVKSCLIDGEAIVCAGTART